MSVPNGPNSDPIREAIMNVYTWHRAAAVVSLPESGAEYQYCVEFPPLEATSQGSKQNPHIYLHFVGILVLISKWSYTSLINFLVPQAHSKAHSDCRELMAQINPLMSFFASRSVDCVRELGLVRIYIDGVKDTLGTTRQRMIMSNDFTLLPRTRHP